MDKNNCDNNSYFYERNYYKDVPIKDTQILEYWNNILGKDVIELIDKAYGVSIEQILFSEYSLNHKYISFATLNQEYSDMCNEKAISYLTKKGTKVLFDQFVLRFLGYGKRVLERKSRKGYIVKVVQDCFLKNLAERILDVSLSTLIFEMYLAKEQGELRGNDEAEEYKDYNQRFLGNDKYIKELFSIYPGLKRMLIELMENLANNYILLQERMEKDTLLLEDKFGGKKGWTEVKNIRTSGSDSHKKGNSVFLIQFQDGRKIVYKPHGLKVEKAYQSFLEFISSNCKKDFKQFLILDCGDYGWEEFVVNLPCNSEAEVRNYYYRIGVLVFCNYILNVNDIHTENLIANGGYPVVVDAETVLDNKRDKKKKSGREKIYDKIHESVLYSGVLPFYKYTKNGKGINMSALNGQEGEQYPILIPRLKNAGTSNMHYEYERPITQASNNLLRLGEKVKEPNQYIDEICEGFFDAYTFCLDNKKLILNYVSIFENIEVRHLVQDTQRYSMLLHTSYNPDFLQDAKDRQLFLCAVLKNVEQMQGNMEIAKLEIKDMLNMDIPYFYSNNWIDLRKFSEVDQHKSQPIAWCHGAAGILLSRLTLYNAIKNLGETALLQQAIKDISLAKNKLIEDGLHAGFCLCHGNMGNLLILKRYAEIFDDKQVRSICDSRFEQILEFLNEENILPTELYNPGFMTGLSGIAYALLKYKMPKLPLLIGVEGIYDRNEV